MIKVTLEEREDGEECVIVEEEGYRHVYSGDKIKLEDKRLGAER